MAVEAHVAQKQEPCPNPLVTEIGTLVDRELGAITAALRDHRVPGVEDRWAELDGATASLRAEMVGARRTRQGELQQGHTGATPASRQLGDLWVISMAATRIVDAVHDLHREAGELESDGVDGRGMRGAGRPPPGRWGPSRGLGPRWSDGNPR
jgi:hypothetical protein